MQHSSVSGARAPLRAPAQRRGLPLRHGRRRALGVVARYEALLEPALDESIRRAIAAMGGGAQGAGAGAGAAALHGAHHAASHAAAAAMAGGAQGGLFLSTFCALSVALGALLYHFGGVVSELMRLQKEKAAGEQEPATLHGVDISRSALLRDDRVAAAARFAAAAHEGQVRKTGEPYVSHCVEAALIVERNLPRREAEADRHRAAVMAALLHDVLDDTAVGYAALEEAFGPQVAGMVAQVSKLSSVNQMLRRDKRRGVLSSDPLYWQSTWRRLKRMMVEAVMAEPLVILIKLADRLHNMRTLHSLPRDKQAAVAEETLHVWCSMAGYLGWHTLKAEMEDLCFAVLEEKTYCQLRQRLDALWSSPPAPRRRRARDSGRRRQLARAAARHERQREERAEARAAAATAAAAGGRGPLAGLMAWAGGGGGGGAFARSGAAAATATADAPAARVADGADASVELGQQQQHRASAVATAVPPAAAPVPVGAAAGAPGASSAGDESPLAWRRRAFGSSTWLSDRGPLMPAPLMWEAEGGIGGLAEGLDEDERDSMIAAAALAAPPPLGGAADASPPAGDGPDSLLTAQQRQLRNILSTVVPFDAVSFKSASDLSWSAQRGLALLDTAAGQLYNELSVGSFGSGLDVVIQGRLKSLYSVHRKMMRKGCSLEEVYDARALRVIVDDCGGARLGDAVQCCYRLVAAVHKLWRPIANEYDDYIANPKASGYQALHTAVWGPGGAALEVQIKTRSMHEDAEYGGAAHWAYKEGGTPAAGSAGAAQVAAPAWAAAGGAAGAWGAAAAGEALLAAAAAAASPQVLEEAAHSAPGNSGGGSGSSSSSSGSSSSSSTLDGPVPVALSGISGSTSPSPPAVHSLASGPSSGAPTGESPTNAQLDHTEPSADAPVAATPLQEEEQPLPALHAVAVPTSPSRSPSPSPRLGHAAPAAPGPYPGQPILRVSHCLRYGAVLSAGAAAAASAEGGNAALVAAGGGAASAAGAPAGAGAGVPAGRSLLAVIQNGGTSPDHPLRIPDYAFYAGLMAYAREHGWSRPGQGDLRARVEEFVLCRDGRWHRRDHLGYTHPDTTLALLEGYEADAAAAAATSVAQAAPHAAEARGSGTPAAAGGAPAAAAGGAAAAPASAPAAAPAVKVMVPESQGGAMAAVAAAAAAAEEQERWQEQWRATATKAAQLRSVIEWGLDLAEGFEAPSQSDEVSVLIWPGGTIEDLPRGTTAGQLFRRKGVLTIEGADGAAAAQGAASGAGLAAGEKRFNVNNRLVGADTQLEDGDLVILANHVLKI